MPEATPTTPSWNVGPYGFAGVALGHRDLAPLRDSSGRLSNIASNRGVAKKAARTQNGHLGSRTSRFRSLAPDLSLVMAEFDFDQRPDTRFD